MIEGCVEDSTAIALFYRAFTAVTMNFFSPWVPLLIAPLALILCECHAFVPHTCITRSCTASKDVLLARENISEKSATMLYTSSSQTKNKLLWKQAVSAAVTATTILTAPLEIELTAPIYRETHQNGMIISSPQLHFQKITSTGIDRRTAFSDGCLEGSDATIPGHYLQWDGR